MTLDLHFLPAFDGDAVIVTWGSHTRHQMLVDLGRPGTAKWLRAQVTARVVPSAFELVIVTHVDADHISGIVSAFVNDDSLPVTFNDIWFNGRHHLNPPAADTDLTPLGPADGERLGSWLSTDRWNKAFEGGRVVLDGTPSQVELPGGMTVTVIGPPPDRLKNFIRTWDDEIDEAIEEGRLDESDVDWRSRQEALGNLVALGRERPVEPALAGWTDLELLADTCTLDDESPANGSSICVILEWEHRRVLLTGDAWADDIIDGLEAVGALPARFDVVKLPHHGSDGNTTDALLDALDCATYVVSTSGSRHYHPDAAAIARVIRQRRTTRPHLVFNVPSEFNEWWTRPERQRLFEYSAEHGDPNEGVTITLTPGSRHDKEE